MEVVDHVDRATLEPLVLDNISDGTKVYSDESMAYNRIPNHQAVAHSLGEYVDGDVSTNSIESQWALMKGGIMGVYHHVSPKHTHRYVAEFAGRHNAPPYDTLDQIKMLVRGMDKSLCQFSRWSWRRRRRKPKAHGRELWGPLNAGTDASAQSLTRVLLADRSCRGVCLFAWPSSPAVLLRQNLDNSPFRLNWITLDIRWAPRMVQLMPRFFIRFAVSLSPLDSMVPRLRAPGGALWTRLRQSIPVTTLDLMYSLSLIAVAVSAGGAVAINARVQFCDPERIAS